MTTHAGQSTRAFVANLGVPARCAIVAVALGIVALVVWLPGLIFAVRAPEPVVPAGAGSGGPELSEKYAAYLAQFDGRSLFFVPSPPIPPPPDLPRPTGPTTPPPPSRYGGPALIALIHDTAWFSDGRRLDAGGEKDGTLRVIRVEAPWNAVVEWQGVEFTVSLFDRDQVVWKEERTPPPEAPAPSEASAENSLAQDEPATTTDAPTDEPTTPTTSAEAPPPADVTPNGQPDSPTQEQP